MRCAAQHWSIELTQQIISSEDEQELGHLGEQNDRSLWAIGDLAEKYVQMYTYHEAGKRKFRVKPMEVYRAIARCAGNGMKSDTVRSARYLSSRVIQELRSEYDMLGRSHHKLIADRAKGNANEHARICGEFLVACEDRGGVGSVDFLAAWLIGGKAEDAWRPILRRGTHGLERLRKENDPLGGAALRAWWALRRAVGDKAPECFE